MSLNRYALGLAAVGISSFVLAQPPLDPTPPGALGIAPGPTMPTQPTLASFMGVSADQRQFRQQQQATTPFGKLRGAVQNPMSKLTGGLIKPFPPKMPTLADLKAPGPVGAAAQVKMDRANAEKRKEAVDYLGTVDCHYWPEAEDALVGALRGDRNESVRYEAATVLLNGCCCTKKIIKALSEAASGSDCDGFPAERSARVRAAAQAALEKCLACFCEIESHCPDKNCEKPPPAFPQLDKAPAPRETEKNDKPTPKPGEKTMGGSYYDKVATMPSSAIIADALTALKRPIPAQLPGPTINQLDLVAAGEPSPDEAGARSPRQTTLLRWFSAKPSVVTAPTMPTTAVAVRTPPTGSHFFAANPQPQRPAMQASRPPSISMAVPMRVAAMPVNAVEPASSKSYHGMTSAMTPMAPMAMTQNVSPSPPMVGMAAMTQMEMPAMASIPRNTGAGLPVHPAVGMASMTQMEMPGMAHQPRGAYVPPAPQRASLVVAQPGRAEQIVNMMNSFAPINQVTAAIDRLTADDLRAAPRASAEIIAFGSRSSCVPVRLATIHMLVRCRMASPEARTILQTAAQKDPDSAVRNAAMAGFPRR